MKWSVAAMWLGVVGAAGAGCGSASVTFAPGDAGTWPNAPTPAFSHHARIVVTDDGDDTLAIVSAESMPALLGFAGLGDDPTRVVGPHHIAASPDGKALFVPLSYYAPGSGSGPSSGPLGFVGLGREPGKLARYDAATYRMTGVVQLDHDPGDVTLSGDGAIAYVSHYDSAKLMDQLAGGLPAEQGYSTIAIVDTRTMAVSALFPVCPTAHGMALSPDEKTLYVACSLSDELAIVDVASHAVRRVLVGPAAGSAGQPSYFPYALTRSPSDGRIWISCNGASGAQGWAGVRAYDPAVGKMDDAHGVALNGIAMFGDWLPDGSTLVVPEQGTEHVAIIDTKAAVEMTGIDVPGKACQRSHMLRVGADGHSAWLTCEGDHVQARGTVVGIDVQARAVIGFVEVGLYSDGFVILPPAP